MTLFRSLYANRWVRYALTLLLLAVVVARIHPGQLLAAVRSVDPLDLLVALVLTAPFLACKIVRWYLMLREARIDATLQEAGVSLVGGMGLALVTPARVGEVVRVAYLRDPQKMKIGGLVMIDKGFDVLVLAALSIAGAWSLLGLRWGILMLVVAVAGLFAVYRPGPIAALLHRGLEGVPGGRKVVRALDALESLRPGATTVYLLLTVLSFAVVMIQFALILLSWRGWDLGLVLLTFPIVILTNVLPITVAGLGVREGVAALLLAHYGVSPAHAALAAFLMFAINTALPGVAGAFLLPSVGNAPAARPVRPLETP